MFLKVQLCRNDGTVVAEQSAQAGYCMQWFAPLGSEPIEPAENLRITGFKAECYTEKLTDDLTFLRSKENG